MSPDPRPDAEQVIAGTVLQELRRRKGFWGWWDGISEDVQDEIACVLGAAALEALRAANIPVGPVDAFRYAEERLLEDANVEAATEAFASVSAEEYNATWGIPAAIRAACRSARGEGA